MSNAAVVRTVTYQQDGADLVLIFDTVLKESFRLATKVTTNPVAHASPISDHATDEQDEVTMTVGVSNVIPFWLDQSGKSIEEHERDGDMPTADRFSVAGTTRSQAALAVLARLRRAHVTCDLQLGLMQFKDMFLTEVSGTTDENTAEVLQADLRFVGIRTVKVRVTKYPPRKDDKTKRSANQSKKKKAEGKEPSLAEKRKAYAQRLMAGSVDGIHHDAETANEIAKFRYPDPPHQTGVE